MSSPIDRLGAALKDALRRQAEADADAAVRGVTGVPFTDALRRQAEAVRALGVSLAAAAPLAIREAMALEVLVERARGVGVDVDAVLEAARSTPFTQREALEQAINSAASGRQGNLAS